MFSRVAVARKMRVEVTWLSYLEQYLNLQLLKALLLFEMNWSSNAIFLYNQQKLQILTSKKWPKICFLINNSLLCRYSFRSSTLRDEPK